MSALANDIKLVHRRRDGRSRLYMAALAFVSGAVGGGYTALSVGTSCAAPWAPRTISSTVLDIGEHLCKEHEGVANVSRVGEDSYSFSCHELAEFPRVPITISRPAESAGASPSTAEARKASVTALFP